VVARIYVDAVSNLEPPVKFPWMDEGACQGKDYKQFFPETKQEINEAKEFCKTHCDVRLKCLAFAMKNEAPKSDTSKDGKQYRHGIYGGLDGKERAALQKVMNEANKGRKTNG
jgi:hypothetical protein